MARRASVEADSNIASNTPTMPLAMNPHVAASVVHPSAASNSPASSTNARPTADGSGIMYLATCATRR